MVDRNDRRPARLRAALGFRPALWLCLHPGERHFAAAVSNGAAPPSDWAHTAI